MLTFVSLFAGIGGFDLGFEMAGMQCTYQVEINEHCRTVLSHHWPDVTRSIANVKHFGKSTYREPVDLICGGFPCQDVSVAGRRKGLDGEQSKLWFEFIRIVEELKPKWVVVENVPGLLSSNGGRDFAIILSGLGQCGYWWAYRILDAQYYGVPQRRRRVFIVGSLGNGCAPEILFEREGGPWDTPPGREARAEIADTITASFARHHGYSAGKDSYPRNVVYQCHGGNVGPMGTLRRGDGSVQSDVPFIAKTLGSHQGRYDLDSIGAYIPIAFAWQQGVSPNAVFNHQVRVRRLTPLECERLQGFPNDWTAVNGMKDSARYRMLGNAVCVPVAEWLGRRIMMQDTRNMP